MFFVNYLREFLYQPLKLSNVRPTDFANSKHAHIHLFFSNQSLRYVEKAPSFLRIEKSNVSPANILHIDSIPSGISFI